MSFLGGRLAGVEGAYFFQETKHAVGRLVQNNKKLPVSASKAASSVEQEGQADVLPEVLRHSLPSKVFHQQPSDSSLSRSSKWVLQTDPKATFTPSSNDMNPLRAYLSLPQVTFGPKRSALSFFSCLVDEKLWGKCWNRTRVFEILGPTRQRTLFPTEGLHFPAPGHFWTQIVCFFYCLVPEEM